MPRIQKKHIEPVQVIMTSQVCKGTIKTLATAGDALTQDILKTIREATVPGENWTVIRDYFRGHGITRIGYMVNSLDSNGQHQLAIRSEGFSEEWISHYMECKLYLIDPVVELAQSATTPFFWSKIQELMELAPEQKDYLIQMQNAGIGDGIAFHVFGPGLRNGFVALGIDPEAKKPSRSEMLDFQLIAQAAHMKYCELNPIGIAPGDLSPREREILQWIAHGKSNNVIAEILELSPHTIDTLVRRIFSKLGVADRTTAAIQGVGTGLILP